MPSVLTESLYMMHPQQEQALRDRAFIDALAEAHVRALELFALNRR
jgi:N-acetylmuramoyl-L-alanine amidase